MTAVTIDKTIDAENIATKQDLRELEYRLIIKASAIMFALLSFFKAMEHFWT